MEKDILLGRSGFRWLGLVLAIAGINYVSGRLGLLLALPPGFATAVWPPSGVALGAVLLFGYRVWPGVWLGSFAMNIFIAQQAGPITNWALAAAVAASIGSGSTVQAIVGAGLIRRWVGFPNALLFERDIVGFLLLGGPLSCVIAATVGIGTLVIVGFMPLSIAPFQWWTWWVGDTIGVLVIMPLLLIALAEPRDIWRGRRWSVGVPLLIAFVISVVFFVYSSQAEQARLNQVAERQKDNLVAALRSSLDRKLDTLNTVAALFEVSDQVSRSEFHELAKRVLPRLSGVQAIEWIPRVPQSRRQDYERSVRDAGSVSPSFTELNGGVRRIAAVRDEYFPVYYTEPLSDNKAALGYDLGSDRIRRAMLERARDSGLPAASDPVTLVQEGGQQHGVLLAYPLYHKGAQRTAVSERRQNLSGFVVMVLRMGDMVTDALRPASATAMLVALDDTTAQAPKGELLAPQLVDRAMNSGELIQPGRAWSQTSIEFAGRHWRLRLAPTMAAVNNQRSLVAWAVLIGGMMFTSLLGAFLLAVTGRAIHVRRLMEERTRADERFRLTVEAAPNAMVLVNQHGLITLINAETERLFRYRREELIGQSVEKLVPDEARGAHPQLRAGYFAAPTARAMGARRDLHGKTKDGSKVPIEIGLSPMKTDEGIFILASIIDITERKHAEQVLTDANRSLAVQVEETHQAMTRLQEAQTQLVQAEKLAALGGLVAGVAHEINTPVGIGVTAASHLQEGARSIIAAVQDNALTKSQFQRFLGDAQQATEIILSNLRRAAELIQSFKRIAVDQSTGERRRINLKAYIEETLVSLKPKMKHTPHRVVLECPGDLEIDTVPGALSQILTNLVINSLIHAFTPDRPGTMTITVTLEGGQITLVFADDGHGIAPEHLTQIFVPFFTTRRGQGGTGLGLNIVFNLVHQILGGTIKVSSVLAQGTVFTLTFPQAIQAEIKNPVA